MQLRNGQCLQSQLCMGSMHMRGNEAAYASAFEANWNVLWSDVHECMMACTHVGQAGSELRDPQHALCQS